jgi:hypothetical protein
MMRQLWEYLADWFAKETSSRIQRASPLDPEQSVYAIIDWARWVTNPARHFWHQLSKCGFWTYVTVNLEKHRAGSMPIYCRLA